MHQKVLAVEQKLLLKLKKTLLLTVQSIDFPDFSAVGGFTGQPTGGGASQVGHGDQDQGVG
jgi:hypothetical protein